MKKSVFVAAALLIAATVSAQAQPLIIGHRAGRNDFEENVLPSFKASYEAGTRGFETDIRETADGKFVISHDSDMKRMYGKTGIVEDMTLAELKKYRTANGNSITTLGELLEFLNSKPGLYVEFEMKTDAKLYPDEKLHKYCDYLYDTIIKNTPAGSTYILSSFDYRALRYLTSMHPGEDCFMLIHGDPINDKTIALAMALGVKRMACWLNGTSRAKVKEAHDKGIVSINLWPGSSIPDFLLAYELGADIICTDNPVEYFQFVKENPWLARCLNL